jgi:hypothetical protein
MSKLEPYFATTPGHMLCPSFKGTMKGRIPRSSVPTCSLAQTTAIQGVPAGIVGGINLCTNHQNTAEDVASLLLGHY